MPTNRAPSRRYRRAHVLAVAVAILAGTGILTPVALGTSTAAFTAGTDVPGNQFTADVMQSPTGFTATSSSGKVDLAWQPTPTTYADGYKVYRSTADTGPWTEIATVPGRTTTTYTDTSPPAGTNYYHVRAYLQNWLSGTTTVGEGTGVIQVTDNFDGTGSLGSTQTGGATWTELNGSTWTRTNGSAATTASYTTNPAAVADAGISDVDITIPTPTASGETIYFRVVDANNWLRTRVRHYTTTSTQYTYGTEYEIADYESVYQQDGTYTLSAWRPYGDGLVCFVNRPQDQYTYGYLSFDEYGRGASCSNRTGIAGSYEWYVRERDVTPNYSWQTVYRGTYWSSSSYASSPDYWTGNTRTVTTGSYQVTNHNYQFITEKKVAGTQSTLATYNVSQPSTLRITAQGSTIRVYHNGTSLQGTLTETAHQSATRHGFGISGPTEAPVATKIDSFTLTGL